MKLHDLILKLSLAITVLLTFFSNTFGQSPPEKLEVPKITPVSPEATDLGRYGDIPIGLYTGIPNINIPIHIVENGELNLPISLSYHATGIKVEQEATWVGLGWNLIAGGKITLTQVGSLDSYHDLSYTWSYMEPMLDYLKNSYSPYEAGSKNVLNDAMWPCGNPSSPPIYREIINAMKWFGNYERDIYHVNFQSNSFKFILHPQTKEPFVLGRNNKYLISEGSVDSDYDWLIIDDKGIKYYFGSPELTTQKTYVYESCWNLIKIEHPSGEEINLNYIGYGSYNLLPSFSDIYRHNYPEGIPESRNISPVNVIDGMYLSSIETENERIIFSHGSREDIVNTTISSGSRKLEDIQVWDKFNDKMIRKFVFSYSYFLGEKVGGDWLEDEDALFSEPIYEDYFPGQDCRKKRLKLNSIQEIGITEEGDEDFSKKPYLFNYSEDIALPYKTSTSKDHWGYYNGKENTDPNVDRIRLHTTRPSIRDFVILDPSLLNQIPSNILNFDGANRRHSTNHIQAGMLTEIIYPTGGKTVFEFEPNSFSNYLYLNDDEFVTGGEDVEITVDVYDYNNDPNQPSYMKSSDNFTLERNTSIEFHGFIYAHGQSPQGLPLQYGDMQMSYIELYKDGELLERWNLTVSDQTSFNENQEKVWEETLLLEPGDYIITVDLPDDLGVQSYMGSVNVQANISYYDRTEISSNKTFSKGGGLRIKSISNYDFDDNPLGKTSYYYTLENGETSGLLISPLDYLRNRSIRKGAFNGQGCLSGFSYTYFDNWNLMSNSNIPLATSANGNYIGYSRVVVKKDGYTGSAKEVYLFDNFPSQTYLDLPPIDNEETGNLKRVEIYDHLNDSVKTINYFYTTFYKSEQLLNVRLEDYYIGPDGCDCYPNPTFYTERGKLLFYPAVQHWNVLTSKIETDVTNNIISTETYNYNLNNYQISKITKSKSNFTNNCNVFIYPVDYANGTSFIDNLVTNNIIATPIEEVRYIENSSGIIKIISGILRTFLQDGRGLIDEVYSLNTSKTIELINYKFSNKPIGILPTDESQNLSFQKDPLYEVNIKYGPYDNTKGNLQQVKKANDIATSFYWSYNNSYPIARLEGINYDDIPSNVISELNSLEIESADLRLINSNIRSLLPNVQITTYTYHPAIGTKTETDYNNKIRYYTYDAFGRLLQIKDDEENILKEYNYHYREE